MIKFKIFYKYLLEEVVFYEFHPTKKLASILLKESINFA